MAVFTKFNSFIEALAEKKHNLGADSLVIALSNSAPVAGNSVLADITQISYTNLSSRAVTITSSSQAAGIYTLVLQDLTLTASGGAVATWRYVILYNDTATNDELIGWWDRGSAVTMSDGDTVDLDFAAYTVRLGA